jgi:hypothetical protein
VALYCEAGALDKAIRQAELFLAQESVADFARLDLEEMVEEMRAKLEAGAAIERLAP